MALRPSQEKLIRCAHCGEDYSPTYRKCPFCGMRNDPHGAQIPEPPRPISRLSRQTGSEADPELTRAIPRVEDIEKEIAASEDDEYGFYDDKPVEEPGVDSAGYESPDYESPNYESPRPVSRRDEEDDGYVFDGQALFDQDEAPEEEYHPSRGGKRLASSGRSRSSRSSAARADINWPRLITFLCALVIIVAAMVILFTVIYPQLRKDPNTAASDPGTVASTEPSGSLGTEESAEPSADVTATPETGDLLDLSMEYKEVKLEDGRSFQLTPIFSPEDWDGVVTWTSSDDSVATVDQTGTVTNVNSEAGTTKSVTITVSAGGLELPVTVTCVGPAAPESQAPAGGEIPAGTKGTVTGATGGLRVRSGPGTTYDVLASIYDGTAVTVVEYAGDGWYQITYPGSGGNPAPGYIMGEYIKVD